MAYAIKNDGVNTVWVPGFNWCTPEEAETIKTHRQWLANPANSHNCSECYLNTGCKHLYENILPCGQYHCLVDLL